LVAQT
jgi:hypothetical protein